MLSGALLVGAAAGATPLVWTLNDVALTDGQNLAGSFTYDYATGVFSDITVVNSGSGSHPSALWNTPFYFSTPRPGSAPVTTYLMSGPASGTNQVLTLDWSQYGQRRGLNDDGGVVSLRPAGPPGSANTSVFMTCGQLLNPNVEFPEFVALPTCAGASALQGQGAPYVASGTLSTVPLPAAGWLLGAAVTGLGGRRWLRRERFRVDRSA